jgi:hypothetical protein
MESDNLREIFRTEQIRLILSQTLKRITFNIGIDEQSNLLNTYQ